MSASFRKEIYVLLLVAPLAGCFRTVSVVVPLPINRFESPERPSGRVNLGLGAAGENYVILTDDLENRPADSQRAVVNSCPATDSGRDPFLFSDDACGGTGFLRADFSPNQLVQGGLRYSADGLILGQLKFYLAGPPAGPGDQGVFSAAVTAAYGRDEGNYDDGAAHAELEQDVYDGALIFGYRLLPALLAYGGPFYSRMNYRGSDSRNEQRSNGLLGSTTVHVTRPFSGEVQTRGANLGLRFTVGQLRAAPYSMALECAWARFDLGHDKSSRSRCGLNAEVSFGGHPPADVPDEEPVEVVPVTDPPSDDPADKQASINLSRERLT